MKQIILGYDGSPDAHRALAAAADLAKDDATLTVVTAVHVPVLVGPGNATSSGEHEHAREALQEARELLAELGVEAEFVEGAGDPDYVLTREATERGADLIVVGTRGLGATKRLVLGSISSRLVHEAPCSVLVVR
jgi:nucleotide-binding universal stress UspA family protein